MVPGTWNRKQRIGPYRDLDMIRRFNSLFVLWVLLASVLAYAVPGAFAWFGPFIVPGLGVIMLGMGLTLVPSDLARVVRRWPAVMVGAACQFAVMPLGAVLVAKLLRLSDELTVGVILVAACPGGTASNVMAYLAGADVALSVSMTTVSTLVSPVMTPLMLEVYAGRFIDVPFVAQGITIATIIVIPVMTGLLGRVVLERAGQQHLVDNLLHVFPAISVSFIVLIVACIVALNRDRLSSVGLALIAAVVLLNAVGLVIGYTVSRVLQFDRRTARTVAIEVGMQNSGLGVALAQTYFTSVVALPSAFYSLWHNITGPALASYWAARPTKTRSGI